MASPGKLMALDVGDARIGIAMSDPLRISCQPFDTIVRSSAQETLAKIRALVQEHSIVAVVVGLPLGLEGGDTEQTKKTRLFIDTLEQELRSCSVQVVAWDERLTTVEAEEIIAGSGVKNRKRREVLDRVSASLILQSYLESIRP